MVKNFMEKKQVFNFDEKFLLLLFFSKENKTLITRAMKLMFIFEEIFKMKKDDQLDFKSKDFGPFAENFQLNMTPLIIGELITFKEKHNIKSNYISPDYIKEYFYNTKNLSNIREVIIKDYIKNNLFKNEINLISLFSRYYKQENLVDLIQFCYYLKPEFTEESIITEQIENHPTLYNQKVILEVIPKLNELYLTLLLKNFEGILKIFNIREDSKEINNYYAIFKLLYETFENKAKLDNQKLIKIIDNFAISKNAKYKFLKYKLLQIIALFEEITEFIQKKNFLIFLLKSIQLKWPLNKRSINYFNKIFSSFKKFIVEQSVFEELDELNIDYISLRKELQPYGEKEDLSTSKEKIKGIREKIPIKKIREKKIVKTPLIELESQSIIEGISDNSVDEITKSVVVQEESEIGE